jgi:hypothetical protein
MAEAAIVKKEEEKKKPARQPNPFSQIIYTSEEKKEGGLERGKAPSTPFHSAPAFSEPELMRDTQSIEQRGRASHELAVRKELEGLKRIEAQKKKKGVRQHGEGKRIKDEEKPPNDVK